MENGILEWPRNGAMGVVKHRRLGAGWDTFRGLRAETASRQSRFRISVASNSLERGYFIYISTKLMFSQDNFHRHLRHGQTNCALKSDRGS